jgi:hypothetical protein
MTVSATHFAKRISLFIFVCLLIFSSLFPFDTSTPEDRAALFDYILSKILERESFSTVKNKSLELDILKEIKNCREEMIAADTDEKLFYALVKISNARKDRHLRVRLVEGGLTLRNTAGVSIVDSSVPEGHILHAPIKFAADFSTPGKYFIFVSGFARNIHDFTANNLPEIGDKLLAINDKEIKSYRKEIEPYHRYSTIEGFWWHFASLIPQKDYQFPPGFYRSKIFFKLEKRDGSRYTLALPYLHPEKITWEEKGKRRYPGFTQLFSTQTYDLYKNDQGIPILLLIWYGFRSDLITDIDRLMEYADSRDLLDCDLIIDATQSRGGSRGAYAVQRLSPKPFKTTFGNVRLSDIIPDFIKRKRHEFETRSILDSGTQETVDEGAWLIDWLENDVTLGIKAGQEYSNNVPFKLAHLPKYSDGIITPAKIHFRGRLVCWFLPQGGSHLDQFASIVADNELGHTIGMSPGGYSNTWEWEETLIFPISKKPVAQFMWSIGHTIRPNGEVLEGNPAKVDDFIPLSRENFLNYYPMLLSKSLEYLEHK